MNCYAPCQTDEQCRVASCPHCIQYGPGPETQCAALAAAKQRTGLSYGQIAERVNSTEQRIIDICTGTSVPTQAEFQAITRTLGIQDKAPSDAAHKTA